MRFIFLACAIALISTAILKADRVVPVTKSPDGRFEVVNVRGNSDVTINNHFEIRDSGGRVLVSQLEMKDLVIQDDPASGFSDAEFVVWREDSKAVAISTRVSKFDMETIVFWLEGSKFRRVPIPEYEPGNDSTFRAPDHWDKDGNLVLDISLDHHTKSEPPDMGYKATVIFKGLPVVGTQGPRTPTVDRDVGDNGN